MFKTCASSFALVFAATVSLTACVQPPSLNGMDTLHNDRASTLPVKCKPKATGRDVAAPRRVRSLYSVMNEGTVWDPIRAHLQLTAHAEQQPAVQKQIHWFTKNPTYLNSALNRAAPYLYYVYTQVEKRKLPTELVLLPIIESAYNPSATNSSSGAAGLWQLMASTARGYGVRQDRSFDGRHDLYSSTNAALDYLTYLKRFFGGDWLLAIAAYDTGEGNVQNAIRHNTQHARSTHFWALPLVLETRSYIPRLLALAAIIKDPEKYGITLPSINARPYLELVDIVGTKMSLTRAAKLAGVSLAELKRLNPGIRNSSATLTQGRFILPIDRVSLYKRQLAATLSSDQRSLIE